MPEKRWAHVQATGTYDADGLVHPADSVPPAWAAQAGITPCRSR